MPEDNSQYWEQQRVARVKKRYGIVFAGGGGKGSYEIGVWKYLHELGLDRRITGISGASVGALNSLLFAQGDYDFAEKLWLDMRQEDMTPIDLKKLAAQLEGPGPAYCRIPGPVGELLAFLELCEQTEPLKLSTQANLDKIIREQRLDWNKILGQDKLIYSALSRISLPHDPQTKIRGPADLWKPFTRSEYRCWAGLDPDRVREVVLASAALPLVYGEKKVWDRFYLDGGIQDNVPVLPLVKAGFREVIVVHLLRKDSERAQIEWYRAKKHLDHRGTVFHHVYPGKEFDDSLWATLTVSREKTEKSIALGCEDARQQLSRLAERS